MTRAARSVTGRHVATCPACGKRVYEDRRQARAARSHGHRGDHLSAYRCPDTGAWHLGHPDRATMRGLLPASHHT